MASMVRASVADHLQRFQRIGKEGGSSPQAGKIVLALLTSLFVPQGSSSPHTLELFAALMVNLGNPYINKVHVLLETNSTADCDRLPALIASYGGNLTGAGHDSNIHIVGTDYSVDSSLGNASSEWAGKLTCIPTPRQPTYTDFFRYANNRLSDMTVLLANTDVVFDESLELIEPAFKLWKHAYVLSVSPPPYGGAYLRAFGRECQTEPRCTIGAFDGWKWGGESADAFVFRPRLQGLNLTSMRHVMNIEGAENRVMYQLEAKAGLELSNPCLHVHAFHWHCVGGSMHHEAQRLDRQLDGQSLGQVAPCWDCHGVRMPKGAAPLSQLCKQGQVQNLTDNELKPLFRFPQLTRLCCSKPGRGCDAELLARWRAQSLPLCRQPGDLDCVVTRGGSHLHYQY